MRNLIRATLDALGFSICVVDAGGRISLVNQAWLQSARAGGGSLADAREGEDFQQQCRAAAGQHPVPEFRDAAAQILAVLEGRAPSCAVEYPSDAPEERRWFVASAVRFDGGAPFTLVILTDVTARKRDERLLAMEHAVTRCLAQAEDGSAGVVSMIRVVCEAKEWACGRYWQLDPVDGVMRARESWSIPDAAVVAYLADSSLMEVVPGRGVMGEVLASGEMAWVNDLAADPRAIHPDVVRASGLHGACVVPVRTQGATLGVLAFMSQVIREPDQRLLEALNAIGAQLGQFLARARSQAELRRNEARFRSLTELSADWYWEQDADFRFVAFSGGDKSEGIAELRAGALGLCRWELPGIELVSASWDRHRATLAARQPFRDFEYLVAQGDGTVSYISASGEPVFDDQHRFVGYRGLSTDITARRREQHLLELEHAVARLLAAGQLPQATLVSVIERICRSEGMACGRYFEAGVESGRLRFAAGWGAADDAIQRFIDQSRNLTFGAGEGLAGAVWQSGKPLWVEDVTQDPRVVNTGLANTSKVRSAFVAPVLSAGKAIGVLSFSCTHMRAPDERLLAAAHAIGIQLGQYLQRMRGEERNRRFRAALDASGDAIVLIDRSALRYVDVNQTFCELVGYTREELLRMSPMDLFSADRETLERDYDALIAQGGRAAVRIQGEYRRKDGSRVAIETSRRALRTEDGWFIVANARDISERIAQERALKDSNERLSRHARRQALAAAFGQLALLHRGADALVREAVRTLTEFADAALLLELAPDGWVVLRDGVGEGISALIGNRTPVLPGSATYEVLQTGVSCLVGEAYLSSRPGGYAWSEWVRGMRSAMFVPLRHDGKAAQQALAVYSRRAQAFGDEDLRFAESVANILSTALQREEAERRGDIQRLRQQRIASFGQFALKRRKVGELIDEAVGILREQADVAAFFEEEDRRVVVLRSAAGEGVQASLGQQAEFRSDSAAGRVLASGHPVRVAEDYCQAVPEEWPWAAWMKRMGSGVFVPVTHDGHAHGMLAVFSRGIAAISDEEMRYAEAIGHLLSTALQREQAEKRLAQLAQFDPLTALPNRSLVEDRLRQAVAQATRKERHGAVLFIDLDRFKLVNDTLGHTVGDELLREVSRRIQSCVRSDDTVGRISGDEFCVVLTDLARGDDAALVAQKVLDALAVPFALAGSESFVTASIGIAVFPGDGDGAGTLLRHADMAMYRAKKSGRNSYRFFTARMNERAVAKMQLDSDLRRAVERREFLLHYQPKVELVGGRLVGMEALLRWNHPQRGLVSPAAFIPALESSGLIVPVGEWVLAEAAGQLRRWREDGRVPVPVAVNLSARQFRRRDLDLLVQRTLQAEGLPASLLELEITESSLADDPQDAVRQLQNLRAAGLRISIDDFGTGYSSLAYLTRLPLSSLKIDRSFVRDAMQSPDAAAIVRAIIDMAHNLQFTVVAEGVETEDQALFLRLHRCEQAQGYLYGKPMSAAEMAGRLKPAALLAP